MRMSAAKRVVAVVTALALVFTGNTATIALTQAWAESIQQASEQAQQQDTGEGTDTGQDSGGGQDAGTDADTGSNSDGSGNADGTAEKDADDDGATNAGGDDANAGDESASPQASDEGTDALLPVAPANVVLQSNEVPGAETTETLKVANLSKTWYDNNSSSRPDSTSGEESSLMRLQYSYDDGANWTTLTDNSIVLDSLNLKSVPKVIATNNGNSATTYSCADDLPATIVQTHADGTQQTFEFSWRIHEDETAAKAAHYLGIETGENALANVETTDVSVKIHMYTGDENIAPDPDKLTVTYSFNKLLDVDGTTTKVFDNGDGTYKYTATGTGALDGPDADGNYTYTVKDLPKYQVSTVSDQVAFQVTYNGDDAINDAGDKLTPAYDNTAVANYGTVTDYATNGGTVKLTLVNDYVYTATKKWLDDGSAATIAARPTITFYLWRYTDKGNNNFEDAAQLMNTSSSSSESVSLVYGDTTSYTDADGNVTKKFEKVSDQEGTITFSAWRDGDKLPKFDAEGYEYVYFVREVVSGSSSYEQLYGTDVDDDGKATGDTLPYLGKRISNDKSVYNGGTIMNRLKGTTKVPGEKSWKAAAHQAYLSGYRVTMKLQSRTYDGKTGSYTDWADCESDGAAITEVVDGFAPAILTKDYSKAMPTYDEQGNKLEYQWVESKVEELVGEDWKDCPLESTTLDDGAQAQKFTTSHNVDESATGRQNSDYYLSTTDNEDGTLVTTNRLAGVVDYRIIKQWYDASGNLVEPTSVDSLSINMYQNGQLYKTYTMTKAKSQEEGVDETGVWQLTVKDLPKYDANGALYDYYAMEEIPSGYHPSYDFDKDNRQLTIANRPGVGGNEISIAKEWLDDSDTAHRLPAVVTVSYETESGKSVNKDVTLNEANNWWQIVGIDSDAKMGTLTVIEKSLKDAGGEYTVDYSANNTSTKASTTTINAQGSEKVGYVTTKVGGKASEGHEYEVVSNIDKGMVDGYHKYTVTNRRIGTVNVKVSKEWLDGNNVSGRPDATLSVSCDEYSDAVKVDGTVQLSGTIERGADHGGTTTITESYPVSNNASDYPDSTESGTASTGTSIKVKKNADGTYYFCGLPKFDMEGKIVHYTVSETYDDPAAASAADYASAIDEAAYKVGTTYHTNDTQEASVTNKRAGSETIHFKKSWKDVYQYKQGNRPDIKLTLWQTTDGVNFTKYGGDGFIEYLWDPKSDTQDAADYDWIATLSGLPKYNGKGERITYYAEETMNGTASNFDYQSVELLGSTGAAATGDEAVAVDGAGKAASDGTHKLLKENGIFRNSIENSVTLEGKKLWENTPSGFPKTQLPTDGLTVYVDQTLNGAVTQGGEGIASTTKLSKVDDTHYTFDIYQKGDNTSLSAKGDDESQWLPMYNADGELYDYQMRDTIALDAGSDFTSDNPGASAVVTAGEKANPHLYTRTQSGYTLSNKYDPTTGSLTVTKSWSGRDKLTADENEYPAVTLSVYQMYRDANGDYVASSNSAYKTQTFAGGATATSSFTVSGLPVYAPDGYAYKYYVVEKAINGQDIGYSGAQGTSKDNPARLTKQPDNSFSTTIGEAGGEALTNTYTPESITINGTKNWDDEGNVLNLRPSDLIKLTVTRHANAQGGQSNAIPTETVYDDATNTNTLGLKLEWNTAGDSNNKWTFTFVKDESKDGEGLQKWAPNGNPWIYTITETVTMGYSTGSSTTTTFDASKAKDGVMSCSITNKFAKSAKVTKSWNDGNNKYGTRPNSISVHLMVAESDKATYAEASANGSLSYTDISANDAFKAGNGALIKRAYGSTTATSYTLKSSEKWTHSFSGLPSCYDKGLLAGGAKTGWTYLYYRVAEVTTPGNDGTGIGNKDANPGSTATGNLIKNYTYDDNLNVTASADGNADSSTFSNSLLTTSLKIDKSWDDNANFYGKRPAKVSFQLEHSIDGGTTWVKQEKSGTVTLTSNNKADDSTWSYTITDLPKCNAAGVDYKWRAVETGSIADYTTDADPVLSTSADGTATSTVTNTLNTASFTLQKLGETSVSGSDTKALSDVTIECYQLSASGKKGDKLFTWSNAGGTVSVTPEKNGAGVAAVKFDDKSKAISGMPEGSYQLVETYNKDANATYCQQLTATLKVAADGTASISSASHGKASIGEPDSDKTQAVTLTDELATVKVTLDKKLVGTSGSSSALGDIAFELYKADGTKVGATYTTASDGSVSLGTLEVGEYYLLETDVPDTVALDQTKHRFKVTNANGGSLDVVDDSDDSMTLKNGSGKNANTGTVTITNKPFATTLRWVKTDAISGDTLTGAAFKVYGPGADSTSEVSVSYSGGVYTAALDEKGTYRLVETKAPQGYTKADDSTITVSDADYGKVLDPTKGKELGEDENGTVEDARILGKVKLAKIDTASPANPLANTKFKLEVKDAETDEYVVYTGDNDEGTYSTDAEGVLSVKNLPWGKYRVSEVAPTDGYIMDADESAITREFTVSASTVATADNTATTIDLGSFTNAPTQLSIAKVDEDGEYLAGAGLKVVDAATQETVDSWTSTEAPYTLTSKLACGHTYVLSETERPAGYAVIESSVTFSVDDAGKMTIAEGKDADGLATVSDDALMLTLANLPVSAISFTKVSNLDASVTIPGATYEVYRLADDTDKTGTKVASATTDAQGVFKVDDLLVSYNYRLHEASVGGTSLLSANDIVVGFERNEDKSGYSMKLVDDGSGTATLADGALTWLEPQTEYAFAKTDESGDALAGAKLQINAADTGETVEKWTSTAEGAHQVNAKLEAGKAYKMVETSAPDGYELADDVEFTVSDARVDSTGDHTVIVTMVDAKTSAPADDGDDDGSNGSGSDGTDATDTGEGFPYTLALAAIVLVLAAAASFGMRVARAPRGKHSKR